MNGHDTSLDIKDFGLQTLQTRTVLSFHGGVMQMLPSVFMVITVLYTSVQKKVFG